jgi:hypothetical protein
MDALWYLLFLILVFAVVTFPPSKRGAMFEKAIKYAESQGVTGSDAESYARWFMWKFPAGDVSHDDEKAFYAWTIKRSQ